jgi:short-subunit dehydrogenase
MEKQKNQTSPGWALITGASAGIGAEFCRQLATKGYSLVLIARRTDKLQALAAELEAEHSTKSFIISADLSVDGASKAIADQLAAENIEVDYLVNNAGFGLPGSFHIPKWQEHADFIQLMMTAVCDLTYQLLPGMQTRRRGFIVNVASVAGLVPAAAGHTLYGASKAFLIKFSEALAAENVQKGIKVSALCPGFTYSEFHDVNNTRDSMNKLPKFLWLDADFVVKECLDAMDKDKTPAAIVPGWQYRMLLFINRHSQWLFGKLMNRNSSKYRKTE